MNSAEASTPPDAPKAQKKQRGRPKKTSNPKGREASNPPASIGPSQQQAGWAALNGSPSKIAKLSETKQIQCPADPDEDPLFLIGRPPGKQAIPLELLHAAFGHFLDVACGRQGEAGPLEEQFLVDLTGAACQYFAEEIDRQTATKGLFEIYLGVLLPGLKVPEEPRTRGRHAMTDGSGCVNVKSQVVTQQVWPFIHLEWKNELGEGGGDPLIETLAYQYMHVWSSAAEHLGLPCLLVELYGVEMKISGVFNVGHRLAAETLAGPFLLQDRRHRERELRDMLLSFRALRETVAMLRQGYLDGSNLALLATPLPYPLVAANGSFRGASKLTKEEQHFDPMQARAAMFSAGVQPAGGGPLLPAKLLYKGSHVDGTHEVVKFTQRYGEELHLQLASRGLAPELRSCTPLSGGWLMVRMQFLGDGWQTLEALLREGPPEKIDLATAAVSRALQQLFDLPSQTFVWGDARPPNIMLSWEDGADVEPAVRFLDFDTAGVEGVAIVRVTLGPSLTVQMLQVLRAVHLPSCSPTVP
ncbi:hypothetical protein WJX73_008815 [Symbiochloris irregularis]|uniref:Protein kinase domain-containing protein n=1 Tax=Symbiochloris irregularis TaxID=706552 RepID=A0AAW1P217_9CHLO